VQLESASTTVSRAASRIRLDMAGFYSNLQITICFLPLAPVAGWMPLA
jgi:hypothetical protein